MDTRMFPFGNFCAVAVLGAPLLLAGCAPGLAGRNFVSGPQAQQAMPPINGEATALNYHIGPLDRLDVTVFQEPDVSLKSALVDAGGNISMPLIGRVQVSGHTTLELSDILADKLRERYFVNPQVSVSIASSVSQRITVQGEVEEPGLYQLNGPTSLLDAIALAKGEGDNASLRQVAILRVVNGQRTGAIFDIQRIRRGDDSDPEVQARDVIIGGHSNGKQVWHDLLKAAPLLNVFTRY